MCAVPNPPDAYVTAFATARHRLLPHVVAYLALVGIPTLLAFAVLRIGATLPPASGVATSPHAVGAKPFDLALLTAQIVVIVATARLAGWAVGRIGQPRVIGEMLAGIVLGPSVLGLLAPSFSAALFPPATLGLVNALAQVGLLLFMFLVGVDFDPALLKNRGRTAVLTSHASIVAPFLLGSALALLLYARLAPAGTRFIPFALFLVILNVGLDIGILTPTLFTMLVIMALVTTMLTTPLLDLLRRGQPPAMSAEPTAARATGSSQRQRRHRA